MTLDHLHNPQLVERLSEFSGEGVVYYPQPGNAGDCLIQAATYQLFEDLNIRYTIFSDSERVSDAIVMIGGGGNLVPFYPHVRNVLAHTAPIARKVIVLPHTIRGSEDLLRELGPNVEIFCRDIESYKHVLVHRSRAKAFLAHDMAFRIDIDRLKTRASEAAETLLLEKIPNDPVERLMAESGHRFFFRKGKEATKRLRPKSSMDISGIFKTGTKPGKAEVGAMALLKYVDRAREVHTDRLHVGIAAALLGKRVYLYDNNYGKVGDVYRHSLHAEFPNVQFIP